MANHPISNLGQKSLPYSLICDNQDGQQEELGGRTRYLSTSLEDEAEAGRTTFR